MIPDLQASMLCDDVRQEANGKFIIIGVFDVVHARQYPLNFPRICVLTRWCGGEGTFQQVTRLLHPDQQKVVIKGQPIAVRLANSEATVTNIEAFLNVPLEKPGIYWVEILLDNDLKLRYPLRVNLLPAPPTPGA